MCPRRGLALIPSALNGSGTRFHYLVQTGLSDPLKNADSLDRRRILTRMTLMKSCSNILIETHVTACDRDFGLKGSPDAPFTEVSSFSSQYLINNNDSAGNVKPYQKLCLFVLFVQG